MAIIEDISILRHVRGAIGKTIVVRQVRGKAVLCQSPTFKKKKRTKKQKATQERFKEAITYAKEITKVPEYKKAYSAAVGNDFPSAYALALADYLRAPKIHRVDLNQYKGNRGDKIYIEATDDFHVASVFVAITTHDGQLIESGQAVRDALNQDEWTYPLTTENRVLIGNKIKVVAKDLPGNTAVSEQEFQLVY